MPRKTWTQSLVLEDVRRLVELGEPPRHSEIVAAHPRLLYAAERYFGSWTAALTAAGADVAEIQLASKASRAEKVTKWSKETIIEQIKSLALRSENMTAAAVRMKYPSLYHAAVSERYFGSWKAAVQEAGVKLSQTRSQPGTGTAWRSQLLLDRIRELRVQYGEVDEELAKVVCPDIVQAVQALYGDWPSAVRQATSEDAD